jgi:cysteinyl-tRNA synthetase
MELKLTNTISSAPETVTSQDGKSIKMYCCGPTVYAAAHIGNFRTFVQQDLLRRVLEQDASASGLSVVHVRNLTDVDDKTIKQANLENKPLREITDKWIKKFHEDCDALGLLKPHKEPRATDYIPEQIGMVNKLISLGHAYVGEDNSVYFRNDYKGKKTRLGMDLAGLIASEDNHVTARDRQSDFVLWKAYKPTDGSVKWQAPFGEGRPGWHIECSAMANAILGDTLDLHSGGVDLKFPHHECEIQQSEAANGKPFCSHWTHTEHLLVEGKKMSKSLNNFWTLDDLTAEGWSPQVVRFTLLNSAYNKQQNFTRESLFSSLQALRTLKEFNDALPASPITKSNTPLFKPVYAAFLNDLNTPLAMGELFTITAKQTPKTLTPEEAADFKVITSGFIGIDFTKPIDLPVDTEALKLAEHRWQAKQSKDFATSDTLRKQLLRQGVEILDSKSGYIVRHDMKQVVEKHKVPLLEL